MGNFLSSSLKSETSSQKVITSLVEDYRTNNKISHIDPDLPAFDVTDDYISLELWQQLKTKDENSFFDVSSKEKLLNTKTNKQPISWLSLFTGPAGKPQYIISAPAGAGKSVLMHHMATRFMLARLEPAAPGNKTLDWPFDWVLLLHCRDFYRIDNDLLHLKADQHGFCTDTELSTTC